MRLRWFLVLLVLATLVPLLAFAAFMVYQHGTIHRAAVERGLLETARAFALALDKHFDATIMALQGLATSEHLDRGDLRAFYRQAQRVQEAHEEWLNINLFDPSGRRLLNTREPLGEPLPPPPPAMLERFRRLVETRRPGVSDLFQAPVQRRLVLSIGVPVLRDGQVRYVLSAGMDNRVLGDILARQRVPADWTLTIVDPQHVIAARSRAPELIGQKATPNFVARVQAAPEAAFRGITLEGVPVYSAYSRSPAYGWTTVLAVPAATVDAASRRTLFIILGAGAALLLGGALLAVWVGRQVTRPIGAIVAAAERLGRGETPQPVRSIIREVTGLSAALTTAGRERAWIDWQNATHARRQAVLADFGRRALADTPLDTLMDEAVRVVARTLDVELTEVVELLPDRSALRLRAGVGWRDGLVGAASVGAGRESQAGFTLLSNSPVVAADLRAESRFSGSPLLRDHGVVSGVSVLIADADGPWGVLGAHTTLPRTFGEDDVAFLQGTANVLGTLIQRARAQDALRTTEEQVRQLQRLEAVGRLAGGVAHDFNNLLTIIMGRTQLLMGRLPPEDPSRRDINLMHKTAGRAANLTKQLLAFSRKQILAPKVMDLSTVVPNMASMLERLIGEDVDLAFRPGRGVGRVKADPGQLEQVVVNLVVNARDAMPDGGRITIETANVELDAHYARQHVGVQSGAYVMLAVSDTGIGMDAETQARIFEPFFTTKGPGKGTGLGLSTVYGIVKQSGGNIWVYSELGKGTTFKVYLPRVEEAEEAVEAAPALPGRGTEIILVAEDEDEVRALAREILEGYGYTVLEARKPTEAIQIAERYVGPIHLLVTDVVMPEMSGRTLAERLAPLRPEMKVVYISGYTDNAIVHHGVLDPGIPFIQKPFTPDGLARKVREVLETPD